MKKIFGFILVLVTALFLVACKTDTDKLVVVFNTDGGTPAVANQSVSKGDLLEAPGEITKDGFVFEYWANGTVEWTFTVDTVEDHMILTAIWKTEGVATDKVTVTFDSQGGSNVTASQIDKGSKLTAPSNPTKAGFNFKEWQLDGTKFDFDQTVTEDITLTAVWTEEVVVVEKVTVKFDLGYDNLFGTEITLDKGTLLNLPKIPVRAGFEFLGWKLDGVNFVSTNPVASNITLVATWEEAEVVETALAHKVNMATLPADETSYVTSPTAFDVLDSVTNTNISFTRLNANIAIPNNFTDRAVVLGLRSGNSWESAYLQNTNVIDNITSVKLDYAIWGTGQYQNLDYAKGIYVQSSVDGITWVNEVDLKGKIQAVDNFAASEVVTFASPAKYVRIFVESAGAQTGTFQMRLMVQGLEINTGSGSANPVEQRTVTFNSNHGNNTPVQVKVNSGRLVSAINPVSQAGHKFLGWYLDEVIFDFNQTIIEDITLVAKWEVVETPVDPVEPGEPGDTELELAHEYKFKEFATDATYVTTPTAIDIANSVAGGSKVGFERLNTAFNNYADGNTQGAVLAIRAKNSYESAYLATKAAVEGLSAVEFNYTVWGKVDQQNLDHATGIYIQTSTDGINWVTVKDIKGEIKNELAFKGVAFVDGLDGDLFVRIFAEKSGTASQYDMRIIVEELRFYINGVPFTGQTFEATLDLAYEGAAAPSVVNVREGYKLSKPGNPTRLGHTFLGWFEVGTDVEFDFNQTINSNVRLFAKWEVREAGENPSDGDENIVKYYASLESLSGTSFVNQLKSIIQNTGKRVGNTSQVKQADLFNGQNYNIYDGYGSYGNREHVVPARWFRDANLPEDDLHNLRAAIVSTNSTRGSYPFGEGSGKWRLSSGQFYPGDEHVGDVARIVLFIHTRNTNMKMSNVGSLDMFLRWHEQDPVSDFERARNNNIHNIQGNRNPFIDYPEYVELLFGAPKAKTISNIDTNISLSVVALPVFTDRRQYFA